MTPFPAEIVLAVSAALTVVFDQATKVSALRGIAVNLGPGVRFRAICNHRGGMIGLSNVTALGMALTAVGGITFLLMNVVPLTLPRGIGLGLMFGGAAGNLVDRFFRGGIIDFIAIGRWRVFNVADLALCTGLALTSGTLLSG